MKDIFIWLLELSFDRMHAEMNNLREQLLIHGDREALEIFSQMETGLFGPMRKLRKKFDIPYHEVSIVKQEDIECKAVNG